MPHSMQEWVAENFIPKLLSYIEIPSLHQTILGLRTSTIEQEVKKLVSSTATINDLDYFGYTALAWAAKRCDIVSAKQVIEYKADPNIRSPQEVNALCESRIDRMCSPFIRAWC